MDFSEGGKTTPADAKVSKTFAESWIMQKLIIWKRIIPENQDLAVLRRTSGNLWTGPGKSLSIVQRGNGMF